MNSCRCTFNLLLILLCQVFLVTAPAAAFEEGEGILVGRIAHVEGKLLRYVDEGKDWVATVQDAPFGLEDALYAGDKTRAEFILPNKTWLRVGEHTQLQLIALNPDATTVDVAAGLARFYNRGRETVIKATTPFGYVVAPGDTVFDLYVGDSSLEVIAVRGTVDFIHDGSGNRSVIREGDASLIADRRTTTRGNGMVDGAWDDWNGQRDTLWSQRLNTRGHSTSFLPDPIRDDAYMLEENGRWERVYYEGAYRDMWRPTRVEPDWRPFTVGRWSVYYGDNCWIPSEPFGYLTHHYGSWVFVESFRSWYWLPPLTRVVADTPRFFIGYGWYPGRVGWIHSGPSIGWVPLMPYEEYYGYRPWGRRTVVIQRTAVININITRYHYLDQAVIIHRDHLYRGHRYSPHVQRNINRATLINSYRPTAVINNTVINNYETNPRRFAFTDAKVERKPHQTVVNRINDNQRMIRSGDRFSRDRIRQEVDRLNPTPLSATTSAVSGPVVTNKLVATDNMAKPLNPAVQEKRELKPRERQRPLVVDDRQSDRRNHQQQEAQPTRGTGREETRSIRATSEAREQFMQTSPSPQSPQTERGTQARPEPAAQPPAAVEATRQESDRRIRSPREMQQERGGQPDQERMFQRRQQEEIQQRQEQETRRRQQDEIQQRQQQETQQRQQDAMRQRQEQETRRRQQDEIQQRQQQETQQRQQDEMRQRQEQETRRRQQEEMQQRQQQDAQQRQQNEMRQRHQEQETRRRQQDEMQQRQQQETQQRQQNEMRQRQEQETRRRQQDEMQQRQQQEAQQRQQNEMQQRQEQETRRRQQEEMRQRQEQETRQRQQNEMQQRQQQETQQRQQNEMRQRQEQETRRRQQDEMQQRQEQETRRRQQEEMQQRQQHEAQQRQQNEMRQRQQQSGRRQPTQQEVEQQQAQPEQPQ